MEKNILKELRRIFNKHDPIAVFIGEKVNFDEYDPEIKVIFSEFQKSNNFEEFKKRFYKVFCKYFSKKIAGNESDYKKMSQEVYDLLKTGNKKLRNKGISREQLIKKLNEYIKRKSTLKELQFWRDSLRKNNFEPTDWEHDESFINEVLGLIDMSDLDGLSKNKAIQIVKLLKLKENTKKLTEKLYKLK